MINECGAVDGMRIGRAKLKYSEKKNTPVPLSPPEIQYDLTCDQTRATTVRSD
jgi:hypothetical protein